MLYKINVEPGRIVLDHESNGIGLCTEVVLCTCNYCLNVVDACCGGNCCGVSTVLCIRVKELYTLYPRIYCEVRCACRLACCPVIYAKAADYCAVLCDGPAVSERAGNGVVSINVSVLISDTNDLCSIVTRINSGVVLIYESILASADNYLNGVCSTVVVEAVSSPMLCLNVYSVRSDLPCALAKLALKSIRILKALKDRHFDSCCVYTGKDRRVGSAKLNIKNTFVSTVSEEGNALLFSVVDISYLVTKAVSGNYPVEFSCIGKIYVFLRIVGKIYLGSTKHVLVACARESNLDSVNLLTKLLCLSPLNLVYVYKVGDVYNISNTE